jgi:subtilisin family serine protease
MAILFAMTSPLIPKIRCAIALTLLFCVAAPSLLYAGTTGGPKRAVFVQFEGAPLAVWVADRARAGDPADGDAQRAYLKRLQDSSQATLKAVESLGQPIFWRYYRVLHGVQLEVHPEERALLERMEGVVSVHNLVEMGPNLESTVPHIEASSVVSDLGFDGTGVRIGVIDSGIDYLHTAFGGAGTYEVYAANNGSIIDDTFQDLPLFPTAKVVGGYDFVGEGYQPGSVPPVPDPDPMPDHWTESKGGEDWIVFAEHGTHVAGIAAGLGNDEVGAGVAPGASLYALKVISATSTTLSTAAIDWASDPDQDGDLSDHLDVLNLSLGSAFSGGSDTDEIPENSAIAAFTGLGGVVVASAGNNGNTPFIVSSPSSAQYALSVANAYGSGETGTFLEVLAPEDLAGLREAKEARESIAPQFETEGPVLGELVYVGYGCDAEAYPEEVVGRVALIRATQCKHVEKFQAAEAAGAIGVVVVRKDGGPKFMGGAEKSGIPGVMIGSDDGEVLIERIELDETVEIRMASDYPRADLMDTLSSGSSRGPAYPYRGVPAQRVIAKPDVTAPGVHIFAPQAGTGLSGISKSGTSMSAPHVAGLVALVKQVYPTWSALELKAAIMNSAQAPIYSTAGNPEFGGDGDFVSHSLQGAGRVRAVKAVENTLLGYSLPGITVDFGFEVLSEPTTLTRTLILVNKGETERTVALSFEWRREESEAGAQVSFEATEVLLAAGEEKEIEVQLHVDPAGLGSWETDNHEPKDGFADQGSRLDGVEYDGHVWVTPTDGSDSIKVPLYGLLKGEPGLQLSGGCIGPAAEAFEFATETGLLGQGELFTLLTFDGDEQEDLNVYDIEAVGMRLVQFQDFEHLQFAFHTRDYWMSPMRIHIAIFMDLQLDGIADYVLVSFDDGYLFSDNLDGDVVAILLKLTELPLGDDSEFNFLGAGHELVLKNRVMSDLLSTNMVLSVPTASFDFGDGPRKMGVWFASFDERQRVWYPEDAEDLVPDFEPTDFLHQSEQQLVIDLDCSMWSFSAPFFESDEPTVLDAIAWPTCPVEGSETTPWPTPVMLLSDNLPGSAEFEIIEIPNHMGTFECPESIQVEVDTEDCSVTVNPGDHLEEGFCTGPISSEPESISGLHLGGHELDFEARDPFGRGQSCVLKLDVVDTVAPEVQCPILWLNPEPFIVEGTVSSTDLCGSELEFVSGACSNAEDEEVLCNFTYEDGLLTVDVQAEADDVLWTMRAMDPSGNENLHNCWLPLPEPGFGPKPASGGCALSSHKPRGAFASMLALVLLLGAASFTIRRKAC